MQLLRALKHLFNTGFIKGVVSYIFINLGETFFLKKH